MESPPPNETFHPASGAVEEPSARARHIRSDASELEGPAVVAVGRGTVRLRAGNDIHLRLETGDLLTLGEGARARLGDPGGAGELLCFRAPVGWMRHALHLAGRAAPDAGSALFVHRSGSDAARRGGRILRELVEQSADGPGCPSLAAAARQLELLSIVFAATSGFVDGRPRERRRVRERREELLEVLNQLETEPLEGVGLATVAHRLGSSERQTSRLFRAELSMTFREFMSELRLKRAKELLRRTQLPVIEVAAETGWRSLAHFTSTFGKRVGMTPSAFRARFAGGEGVEAA